MGRPVVSRRVLARGLACAGVLGWTFAALLSAQGESRERTIFVTVLDRMDNPVEGLDIAELIVREDGQLREGLRLSRATEPIDVALLIDNGASSGELIPRVREGLKDFVATMTPQHSVALIALADRPTIFVDYTTNAQALLTGSGRLFTMARSGMTLLDGLVEVSDGLRRRETARTALVPIVTDGPELSNRRYPDVIEAIRRSGAGFYPITVGRFLLTTDGPDHDRTIVLGATPEGSGGQRVNLLAASAIESAMARVARLLTSQYKLVYSRPETLIPPEKIEVTSTRPGLTVRGTPMRTGSGGAK